MKYDNMPQSLPDWVLLAPFVLEVIKFLPLSDKIIFPIWEYYRLILGGCPGRTCSKFGSRPALCGFPCPPRTMSHPFVLFFAISTLSLSVVNPEEFRRALQTFTVALFPPLSFPSYHRRELLFVLFHGGGSVAKLQRPAALSDHLEHGGWQAGGRVRMFHWSEVWCVNVSPCPLKLKLWRHWHSHLSSNPSYYCLSQSGGGGAGLFISRLIESRGGRGVISQYHGQLWKKPVVLQ